MLRTFGLELVNFHPAWEVPKGSRSASRRARKTVCESLKNFTRLINRNSESSNMPVSGSEKVYAPIEKRFNLKLLKHWNRLSFVNVCILKASVIFCFTAWGVNDRLAL